jgi:hypothetical protein
MDPTAVPQLPLFPNAKNDVASPESAGDVAKVERAAFRKRHATTIWIVLGVVALLAIASTFAHPVAALVVIVVLGFIPAIITWFVITGRAHSKYWQAYADARGVEVTEDGHLSGIVPLMSAGDKREYPVLLTGPVGDTQATFGLYTYTVVTYTTDSDGRRQRQETDHDFSIVSFQLPEAVANRFAGIYVRPKTLKLGLGGLQDKFGHDQEVKLESVDFHKKREVRMWDSQDKIALFELFSTTFIDAITTDLDVFWEQIGPQLLVYRKKHIKVAAELDDLVSDSLQVYRRYCQEYQ